MKSLVLALLCLVILPVQALDLPREVAVNGVRFVLIPEGPFWYTVETGGVLRQMAPDQPYYRHVRIWLDAYYLSKYEARARDLARFLNSGDVPEPILANYLREWHEGGEAEVITGDGCTMNRSETGNFSPTAVDKALPATYLTWELADSFARWMGFRLPTEAEWQKGARGTDRRIWPWGDIYPDDTYAYFGNGRRCRPEVVDTYPQGRSPYGLYQMAGNVNEYVADWYNEDFDAALADGDRNPEPAASGSPLPYEGPKRISKGGPWSRDAAGHAIGYRRYVDTDRASNRDGLRFALDAEHVAKLLRAGEAHVIEAAAGTKTGGNR